MSIQHDDGWESYYIHMNNDTPGTDDGLGQGIAPGIEPGVRVRAGQLIGWVGDSGNAENSGSHVHFELHKPDGTVVNPTPYVDAAFRLTAPLPTEQEGSFWDDDYSVHRFAIDKIADVGITKGCNPPVNDRFCPDGKVTREQMAAFLTRAFGYTDDGGGGLFTDTAGSTFSSDIDKLATAGVTLGCNPPDNDRFFPSDLVQRDQMASFLARALGLPAIAPPPPANPGDTKNCSDFPTWAEAQEWFNFYFPYYGDIANLDGDNNGVACESLPGAP